MCKSQVYRASGILVLDKLIENVQSGNTRAVLDFIGDKTIYDTIHPYFYNEACRWALFYAFQKNHWAIIDSIFLELKDNFLKDEMKWALYYQHRDYFYFLIKTQFKLKKCPIKKIEKINDWNGSYRIKNIKLYDCLHEIPLEYFEFILPEKQFFNLQQKQTKRLCKIENIIHAVLEQLYMYDRNITHYIIMKYLVW
jgi:hypothetical protein